MQNDEISFEEVQEAGSNIKRVHTKIQVELLRPHLRTEKKQVAQIRCKVESTYPEAGVGNSLNDSIFGEEDFGFGEGQTFEENRVAFMDVPAGLTVKQVQEKLDAFPNARIYRTLSLTPILTDQQKQAMERGISEYADADGVVHPCDMDYYKRNQMIPTPETASLPVEQRQPLLYEGYVQYRVTAFSKTKKDDIDLRPEQLRAAKEREEFKMNAPVATAKTKEYAEGY